MSDMKLKSKYGPRKVSEQSLCLHTYEDLSVRPAGQNVTGVAPVASSMCFSRTQNRESYFDGSPACQNWYVGHRMSLDSWWQVMSTSLAANNGVIKLTTPLRQVAYNQTHLGKPIRSETAIAQDCLGLIGPDDIAARGMVLDFTGRKCRIDQGERPCDKWCVSMVDFLVFTHLDGRELSSSSTDNSANRGRS